MKVLSAQSFIEAYGRSFERLGAVGLTATATDAVEARFVLDGDWSRATHLLNDSVLGVDLTLTLDGATRKLPVQYHPVEIANTARKLIGVTGVRADTAAGTPALVRLQVETQEAADQLRPLLRTKIGMNTSLQVENTRPRWLKSLGDKPPIADRPADVARALHPVGPGYGSGFRHHLSASGLFQVETATQEALLEVQPSFVMVRRADEVIDVLQHGGQFDNAYSGDKYPRVARIGRALKERALGTIGMGSASHQTNYAAVHLTENGLPSPTSIGAQSQFGDVAIVLKPNTTAWRSSFTLSGAWSPSNRTYTVEQLPELLGVHYLHASESHPLPATDALAGAISNHLQSDAYAASFVEMQLRGGAHAEDLATIIPLDSISATDRAALESAAAQANIPVSNTTL